MLFVTSQKVSPSLIDLHGDGLLRLFIVNVRPLYIELAIKNCKGLIGALLKFL